MVGWIAGRFNDVSDAQWRNFRGNLPILILVFGIFTLVSNMFRTSFCLEAKGMSIVWLLISLAYLSYLHGACIIFVIIIASANFLLVKIFGRTRYFSFVLWSINLLFLLCNRMYEGYRFSSFGRHWAYLDNFRGTFRWHICFNFVVLRMICFGYDYHWADQYRFDQKKHIQRCDHCSSGKTCYLLLQEQSVKNDKFSFPTYLCYLVYAPLYIAGPIISFNAFVSQVKSALWEFVFRELSAVAGAVTITCLMVANLVGFVIEPSGINWLVSGFLKEEGLPYLGGLLFSFYVGTKLMFHISDAKQREDQTRLYEGVFLSQSKQMQN